MHLAKLWTRNFRPDRASFRWSTWLQPKGGFLKRTLAETEPHLLVDPGNLTDTSELSDFWLKAISDFVTAVLAAADSQLGVREEPLGSNSGPEVNAYLRSVGLGPGQPWCAAFVYWCIREASNTVGASWVPWIASGDCWALDAWSAKSGIIHYSPQPGDVFLVGARPQPYHTGIVVEVDGSRFYTIEGNTNPDGGSEGYGVFARNRSVSSCYFARWSRLIHETRYQLYDGDVLIASMPRRSGQALCPVRKLADHLKFQTSWDEETQSVRVNNILISEITFIDAIAYAPIRKLATLLDFQLSVSGTRVDLVRD